ncbi:butyrophilin subfamily 2 member A2-like isoform X2 [Protopterus annectens]|uniref:butyrophilin subfamily 2 member A2-like isoform X2 n=1 Tax=Protopterus annectens TaxID=7888 RepID=UPI001CFAA392|nr:butyrophilin subfamily 2 member A2-like isoform X2 [Protopterus annectens]
MVVSHCTGLNVTIGNTMMQANIGENVSLQCHFTLKENTPESWLKTLFLQWNRKDEVMSVYSIENGMPNFEHQAIAYKNKVIFDEKQLPHGKATLVLTNVQVNHEGIYQCYVQLSIMEEGEAQLHLSLVANYSKPIVSCSEEMNGFVNLSCQVSGGYPEGVLEWRFSNGTQITDIVMNTLVHKDEKTSLYSLFSVILILKNLVPEIACVVRNPRTAIEVQEEVKCQEDLSQSRGKIGIICSAVLLLGLLGLFVTAKCCCKRAPCRIKL